MTDLPAVSARIRSFQKNDQAACLALYREGLIGTLAPNDTGLDVDDIHAAYFTTPGSHFWVAENEQGQIVGMIGVQQLDSGVGEIRRLRVSVDHRRMGIGSSLLETAIRFCREHHLLKVKLDTFTDRAPAMKLFEKFQFRHSHVREVGQRQLLYFYLDLYLGEPPRRDEKKS